MVPGVWACCGLVGLLSGCLSGFPSEQVTGRHVVVQSNLSPQAAARIQQEADLCVVRVCGTLGLTPPATPVKILLFDSAHGRRTHLSQACPRMTGARAACYEEAKGRFGICLSRAWTRKETLRLLRHELTHYAVASRYPNVPPWLDEGLARCFELGAPVDRPHAAALKELRKRLRSSSAALLPKLVGTPAGRSLPGRQYAEAWGLAWYALNDTRFGAATIRSYLKSTSGPFAGAAHFTSVFGLSPDELEPKWRAHMVRVQRSESPR